jgi:hypothetical protein
MTTDIFTRLTADDYGKGSGICFIAQPISSTDLRQELINRAKQAERDGLYVTPWRVVASPFLVPSREDQARILGAYPSAWNVVFPRFGEIGQPVSRRFSLEFAQTLKANMSPADWACQYELDPDSASQYCAWKRSYLQELDDDDIHVTATFLAVDTALVGGEGRDQTALVAAGVQDGNVAIVGLHFLTGDVDEQLAQIVEYAALYNAHSVGVEAAASGFHILKSLDNRIGDRTFNVVKLSHKGKNKGARLAEVLGPAANGKFFIRKGLELAEILHEQLRTIAVTKGKTHRNDDLGDAAVHCLSYIWNSWVKSGYGTSVVSWQGGGTGYGVTQCSWGRGQLQSRRGLDGVERVLIPGFE